MCKAYLKDANMYREQTKDQFQDIKYKFRSIINGIKTDQHEDFKKLAGGKKADDGAHERLEKLKKKLKD